MPARLGRTLQIISEQEKIPVPQTGFQPDGSLVKKITRRTVRPDGKLDFSPPVPGQLIITEKGKFKVGEIMEEQHLPEGHFFRASGEIIK